MTLALLKAFSERALKATNIQEKLLLGKVANHEAIVDSTKMDVQGFSHVLENFGLKHGFKHHGNQSIEAPRGQRAVKIDDVLRVPEAIANPDKITFDGLSKHSKQPVIGFEKRFGAETLVYKAEVRKGKRELATQTFYVRVGQ
jgi:phage-Barnase-EndoU-ColicinE5/D-RelE like nuclease3